MGEGTSRVEALAPREIEREIEHVRARLDRSLAEIDRRRHELTDLRLQMRKHPGVFIGVGGFLFVIVGGVVLAVWRSHKRDALPEKVKRLRVAVERAVDKPRKVARGDAPPWEKILAAVGTTLAVGVTKRLLDRLWSAPPKRDLRYM
jgi:hypothetical protein